jgi:serine/threonine protein kinase/Leucine-rich repeat (LRR) protein
VHTKLNRIVAIKLLPVEKTQDAICVDRFLREMQAIGKLDDPHIVRAMDAGEEAGIHFLVMELLDGIDLSTIARRLGPVVVSRNDSPCLTIADACEMVRQVACGLHAAHRLGMVHRDIKPSNLMLVASDPPIAKLLDLGLARLQESGPAGEHELTVTGQVMGTLDYMAPEQGTDSHIVDLRADVYSLGATLYRLLTGTVPFPRERYNTPARQMIALVTDEVSSVGGQRPDLPAQLVAVVDRMLAKDPADRFSTAEEVAESLAPFAAGADLAAVLRDARRAEAPAEESRSVVRPDSTGGTAGFTSPAEPAVAPVPDKVLARPPSPTHARTSPSTPLRVAPRAIGLLVVLALIALSITQYRLPVRDGTLVVELDGAEVSTVMVDGKQIVDFKTAGDGKQLQLMLEPGSRSLTLKTADGTELKTEVGNKTITILAGQQTRVRAWLEAPGDAAPAATELVGPDYSADQSVARWILSLTPDGRSSIDITGLGNEGRRIESLEQLDTEQRYRIHRVRLRDRTTDAELKQLNRLRWLQAVSITRYYWSQEAIGVLCQLHGLTELLLSGNGIHGTGCERLAQLRELSVLGLRDSSLAADDLAWIQQLPALEQLSLHGSPLSADSLVHLKRLKNLRRLDVRETGTSPAMVEELAAALPDCRILHEMHPVPHDEADRRVAELVLSSPKSESTQTSVGVGTEDVDLSRFQPGERLPEISVLEVILVKLGSDSHGLTAVAPWLGKLRLLDALQVHHVRLDQQQLKAICESLGLEKLLIQGTGISDEDLARLASLTRLRHLQASDNRRLTDTGLTHLAALPRLACLDISNTGLTDRGLQAFAASPRLAFLNVKGTQVTAAAVANLRRALPDCEITSDWTTEQILSAGREPPRPAPAATSLAAPDYSADRDVARWVLSLNPQGKSGVDILLPGKDTQYVGQLDQLPGEEGYRVYVVRLKDQTPDADLNRLARLQWLQAAYVTRYNWTAEAIAAISKLSNLTALWLDGSGIHEVGCERLGQLKEIVSLGLRFSTLARNDLAWVQELPTLERLNLRGSSLSEESLVPVRQLRNLKILDVRDTGISPAMIDELASALPNCRIIHEAHPVPRDEVDRRVAELILSRPKSRNLFVGVGIADGNWLIVRPESPLPDTSVLTVTIANLRGDLQGLRMVSPLLGKLPRLDTLQVHHVRLDQQLLNAICESRGLERLLIQGTGISDEDLARIASLCRMRYLYAADNPRLTDRGLAILATLPKLARLDIRNTSLTDSGLLALAAARQLAFLNIKGTNVSAAGVANLRRLLPNCEITSDFTTDQILKASAELPRLTPQAAPGKTETE